MSLELTKKASLSRAEVIALTLLTGPMVIPFFFFPPPLCKFFLFRLFFRENPFCPLDLHNHELCIVFWVLSIAVRCVQCDATTVALRPFQAI